MTRKPHILMVATSHGDLGATGLKTGLWLEGFAAPYYVFADAGAILTIASPDGGLPPIDPRSMDLKSAPVATRRFRSDPAAQTVLRHTVELKDLRSEEFDAVFYPGGHGPMWDLSISEASRSLLESFIASGKCIGAVCHAPAALLNVTVDNVPFLQGKAVTAFSDVEEDLLQLSAQMPFSLEQAMKDRGAKYVSTDAGKPFAVVDGTLVTGQNPASSTEAALDFLRLLSDAR